MREKIAQLEYENKILRNKRDFGLEDALTFIQTCPYYNCQKIFNECQENS